MKLADKGLNIQAQIIEEAQSFIRIAVRDGWLYRRGRAFINTQVQKIIRNALSKIDLPILRDAAYRSLNAFAERQYATYVRRLGTNTSLLLAVMLMLDKETPKARRKQEIQTVRKSQLYRVSKEELYTDAKGISAQVYAKEYLEKRVAPVIKELCEQNAIDPDDISGRNSMRNRAEMEVRYNGHLQQIADMKSSGIKLVTCSVHADCSERCYKWQGRVYSLDGTSGMTDDGKPYIPLETATDVYYTTKAGKTYKNGLLGFNCRHYLMPYVSGMVIPHISKTTQHKENAVNTRQRELERLVRGFETEALMNKDIDPEKHAKAKAAAIKSRREYIKFSQDNGRAYYPSRIKLL